MSSAVTVKPLKLRVKNYQFFLKKKMNLNIALEIDFLIQESFK